MARRLIVNADDFGCTEGVTRGIIRAHREGIVTSTSVMVNMPGAADGVRLAQQQAPKLGLGLHLTLTAGPPCADPSGVPDLVNAQGKLRRKDDLLPVLEQVNLDQIERECRAQIARFVQVVGRLPDHLDSHHHATYLSTAAASMMIRLAHELGVPIRRPLPAERRAAAESLLDLGVAQSEEAAAEAVFALGNLIAQAQVPAPDWFIAAFFGRGATLGDLLNLLVGLPEGISELMCHPGEVDDQLRATSGYVEERAEELTALTHPSVREVIRTQGIELASFEALRP